MSKIFDIDSPIMRFLTKMADLMILNLLVLLCCIPIITIGAAFTAMHYVLLKMVRGEEGYVVKSFFKSFKQNFKQSTIIWLIALVLIAIFVGDWFIFRYATFEFPQILQVLLLALVVIVCMILCYVFPVLSRFENTVFNTIKNSFLMAILSLPKTVLMIVMYVLPVVLLYFIPQITPLVFCFGFTAPAYVSAMLYSGTFGKFEPQEEGIAADEEFHINDAGNIAGNRGDGDEK